MSIGFLVVGSLFFYGWWEPVYLLLIVSSIIFNYSIAQLIIRQRARNAQTMLYLVVGICGNLFALGFFKYSNFFLETFGAVSGASFSTVSIVLPLAISFYTFQQIAFLVDVYARKAEETDLLTYSLFVTFFPQLIAGPIVHHREMMGQFKTAPPMNGQLLNNLAVGSTIIAIGLFKKVVLSEKMAFWSDRVFSTAALGTDPTFIEAWIGVLAFTFQIYFDFSGYSDIAIGLARLFNIRLPLNFDAPYKSRNIVEFWRKWHMTLSRFLRDYVYFPLGGNRKGGGRRYLNLMIVMGLGGLWHGAGWTFVLWGLAHGAFLTINHFWHRVLRALGLSDRVEASKLASAAGLVLTFVCVALTWTLFRAESMMGVESMFRALVAFNQIVLPHHYQAALSSLTPVLDALGVVYGSVPLYGGAMQLLWLAGALMFVWFFPTTQELMHKFEPALDFKSHGSPRVFGVAIWAWRPSLLLGIVVGGVTLSIILKLLAGQSGEFIYFQF
ncbi:MBOAT family O-acyltransferase [Magnetovibrio sp. PR-2]|uniref:MBOAT family O-acyltransferase n=1 Tax=Magnetovibrio sp. PR-2 TaxID=3120356 RepID=UPI002FCE01E0